MKRLAFSILLLLSAFGLLAGEAKRPNILWLIGEDMSGPKYYQRFRDICVEMVNQYGVNQFKFDGLAAGGQTSASGFTRDGDAMLKLIADLRAARPDIYINPKTGVARGRDALVAATSVFGINQTTGTWPSPFWLLWVDSKWRGWPDFAFNGKGSERQRWITFRDRDTYRNVVRAGPLYPLNSMMLHGIIYAANAKRLTNSTDADFAAEVRSFFGSGTQLQELYLTPSLLNRQNWDDLAEAAKWARANADVLVDTHWIGGDPGKGEIYGWTSWTPRRGVLVLRNPDDKAASFKADVAKLFELPSGAKTEFTLRSPWKADQSQPSVTLRAGEPHTFKLKPFEVLVLESK